MRNQQSEEEEHGDDQCSEHDGFHRRHSQCCQSKSGSVDVATAFPVCFKKCSEAVSNGHTLTLSPPRDDSSFARIPILMGRNARSHFPQLLHSSSLMPMQSPLALGYSCLQTYQLGASFNHSYYWPNLEFPLGSNTISMIASTPSCNNTALRRRRHHTNPNSNPNTSIPRAPSLPLLEYRPETSILHLIRERDWYGVQVRLHAKSRESLVYDLSEQTTPLHAACLYRAPHDVILHLIHAYPSSLLTTDAEGWIPLHVHLLYSSHEPTTLALIQAGGMTAANLHLRFGGAALHLACRHGAGLAVLQALVSLSPGQIATPTPSGSLAAHMVFRQPARERKMDRLMVLIQAWAQKKTVSVSDVIRFQVKCAPAADVVGEYLKFFGKGSASAKESPLHVAAAAPMSFCDPLPPVLEAFPEAACVKPYALHVALRNPQPFRNDVLMALTRACPMALEERDAHTRLYPFQIAAISSYSASGDKELETLQLNKIYSFLRKAPHIVGC